MNKRWTLAAVLVVALLIQAADLLRGRDLGNVASARTAQGTTAEVLGVYFTPPAGAASAIVSTIDGSQREVLVQAYGFTHNAIAQALIRARQRGVAVRVLLDEKSDNTNRYVIDLLTQAQVPLMYDGKHAIAHNKVMVIDETVVITGSFNFTNSAETRNAENFLILKSTDLAQTYKSQWQQHWNHAQAVPDEDRAPSRREHGN